MAELAQADVPPLVSMGQRLPDRVRIDTDSFPNFANSVLTQKFCAPVDPCGQRARKPRAVKALESIEGEATDVFLQKTNMYKYV